MLQFLCNIIGSAHTPDGHCALYAMNAIQSGYNKATTHPVILRFTYSWISQNLDQN